MNPEAPGSNKIIYSARSSDLTTGKVTDLLKFRPVQFCLFLKALVGVEEMQGLMVEAIEAASAPKRE